jgi:iron complex transport system ATP-binding protein
MAVCQNARYLLLDEPTAYLDPAHSLNLMGTLRGMSSEGRGIVAVMHDLPMAFSYFDRIMLVDGGRVAASGTPCELFDSEILKSTMGVRLLRTEEGYCYGRL